MINSSQFVNGLWMGTVLLVLGVTGLLDGWMSGISRGASDRFRSLPSAHTRFASQFEGLRPGKTNRGLVAMGLAIMGVAFAAFFAR